MSPLRSSPVLLRVLTLTISLLLGSCSSGGSSQSGLGLDLSGFWTGTLTERSTGRYAGSVNFGLQSAVNQLTGTTTSPAVSGTFTYENALSNECPLASFTGIITGSVIGNTLVMSIGQEESALAFSATVTNQRMTGDWSLSFQYTVNVATPDTTGTSTASTTETQTVTCQILGNWQASKRSS